MVKKLVDSILVENLTYIHLYVLTTYNQRYSKTFHNSPHVYEIILTSSQKYTLVINSPEFCLLNPSIQHLPQSRTMWPWIISRACSTSRSIALNHCVGKAPLNSVGSWHCYPSKYTNILIAYWSGSPCGASRHLGSSAARAIHVFFFFISLIVRKILGIDVGTFILP